MNSTTNCIFCKIISREIPAPIVYETDTVLAFLDAKPLNPGHTLVIPKSHFESITDCAETDLHECISGVQKVASALKKVVNADGINIGQNNGRAAGQVIFHTHFHVIPRYSSDGFKSWHRDNPDLSRNEEIAKKLKEVLG